MLSRLKLPIIRPLCTSLRDYVFPELKEKDLEEEFIHGSGPGGQKVNKSFNCVLLKHKPTGLFVKVHDSRIAMKNQEIARQRLQIHLDNHLNGENSYQAQKKRIEAEIAEKKRAEKDKRREMKEVFKKMLALEEERKKSQENGNQEGR